MQFHYYETDYRISYKFEIIVMLIMCVKQHCKNRFSLVFISPFKMCYWKLYKILSKREDAKGFDLIKTAWKKSVLLLICNFVWQESIQFIRFSNCQWPRNQKRFPLLLIYFLSNPTWAAFFAFNMLLHIFASDK